MSALIKISEIMLLPTDAVTQTLHGYSAEALINRLIERTIFDSGEKKCWEWTGYKRNGYGSMSLHDRPSYIHSLAWKLFRGEIPGSLFVLHQCDNRPCWRPGHLFLGTQRENLEDMRRKQRHSDPPRQFGINNQNATLTDDQVRQIRARGTRHQRQTADEFGVSQSTIWRLVHGITRAAEVGR